MVYKKYLKEKLNKFKIFCDMDGVLTDFENQAKKVHPDWIKIHKKDPDMAWKMLNEIGFSIFWSTMMWMSDGRKLWEFIKPYNPVILTAIPSLNMDKSKSGKIEWIIKHLGWEYVNSAKIVRAVEKQKYAKPNYILIDDKDKNIRQWRNMNGVGILHKSAYKTINELKDLIL